MKRSDLEHLIRAAAAITNEYEIMIVGSQSILGAVPEAPDALLQSIEADMYPLNRPELSDLIDGSIGEASIFEERFGYYAQGVGPETAVLPEGWQSRLVKIQNENTDLRIGYCLDPHDLAASKLAAGRDKDWDFVRTMLQTNIVQVKTLSERIKALPIAPKRQLHLLRWSDANKPQQVQTEIQEKGENAQSQFSGDAIALAESARQRGVREDQIPEFLKAAQKFFDLAKENGIATPAVQKPEEPSTRKSPTLSEPHSKKR